MGEIMGGGYIAIVPLYFLYENGIKLSVMYSANKN